MSLAMSEPTGCAGGGASRRAGLHKGTAGPPPAADAQGAQACARGHRLSSETRRQLLIEATLAVIASEGLRAATLRRVAEQAGVSNGLIRHHFSGKRQLILDSYATVVARMTAPGCAALARTGLAPRQRLVEFVRASLDPALCQPQLFSAWAAFVALVHVDEDFRAIHRAGYRDYHASFVPLVHEVLVAAGHADAARRADTFAAQLNALFDGLWIEGSLLGDEFDPSTLVKLGLDGASRILNIDLGEAS